MAKNDSIFRYTDSDSESTPQEKEVEVVPQISKDAERNVEEYEPPKIDRKRLSFLDNKKDTDKTSRLRKGGESR